MSRFGQQIFKAYKFLRWVMLLALVLVLALALRRPAPAALPPAPEEVKQNAESLERKLQELEQQDRGSDSGDTADSGGEIRLNSDEVNSFVAENTSVLPPSAESGEPVPELKAPVVAFVGDEVIAQTSVHRYGRDIVITVRGRLGSRDGYLTFAPTGFKIGELSIPVSLVDSPLQQKLAEPENREKLRLPAFVGSLRIENGELVMVQK